MRIEKIETLILKVNSRGNWVLVLVRTDQGPTGIGEASHSHNDAALVRYIFEAGKILKGRDPGDISLIWREMNLPQHGRVEQTALSGIEQALWDIKGKVLGVPVFSLLGGALRKKIALYANINRSINDRSPSGFAAAAETAAAQGFKAIKIAPFDELNSWDRPITGTNALWKKGVERVSAVRLAIGQEIELAVDCHNRFEPGEAILAAKAMEELDLFWFEEPINDAFPRTLSQVAAAVPMPVASGENGFGLLGFKHLLLERVVDVIMPDVKQAGGILEMCKIAEAAQLNHILVSPHCPSGPVSAIANAQASATMSNFCRQEHAWGEVDWRKDVLDPPELIEDGCLILSDRPGLGHTLNNKTISQHTL